MYNRISVFYKETTLDLLKNQNHQLDTSTTLYQRMKSAHDNHYKSLDILDQLLKEMKLKYHLEQRIDNKPVEFQETDLLLTLGGDGTFIFASHFVEDSAILGINSAPASSVGYYCKYDLFNHLAEIRSLIEEIFTGKEKETILDRIEINLNAEPIKHAVINDCLLLEENPSITTRYRVNFEGQSESQKSSGLWMTSASGSSAAFSSAGGSAFSARSSANKRQFGFISREVYRKENQKLLKGLVEEGQDFSIESEMVNGRLYFDGGYAEHPVKMGDVLTVSFYQHPLRTFL